MKKKLLTLAATLFALVPAFSQQTPQLVKTSGPSGIKYDAEGKEVNGKLVFRSNGKDLYVSDGTDQGTQVLRAGIFPGGFSVMNNQVFFAASDSVHDFELWKTDGTAAGTGMVKDINPYGSFIPSHLHSDQFVVMGSYIYFVVTDDSMFTGRLWRSDGTGAGTLPVTDINGDTIRTAAFDRYWATVCNNKLYFAGIDNAIHGMEVWETDGTPAGTHMSIDVLPGYYGSGPNGFFTCNNHIYFNARDTGAYQNYMYVSDGTPSGTHNITGSIDSDVVLPTDYVAWHDTLLFITSSPRVLWRTDGTVAGTSQVIPVDPVTTSSYEAPPHYFTFLNGKLFFSADSPGPFVLQRGVWRMDNAGATPSLIYASYNGARHLKAAGNALYFKSVDSTGFNLWRSNGTTAGTAKITMPGANVSPSNASSYITARFAVMEGIVHALDNRVYYTMLYDTTRGVEFYSIDMFPLAVPELTQHNDMRIYPNPARTVLTVAGVEVSTAEIYSIAGMLQQKQAGNNTVDVSGLAPGQYFLHISTRDKQQLTERFAKY